MRDPQNINILEMIPQRPPFVMVDKLTHYDDILSITELKVNEHNIFCKEGCLNEYGIIENIAQSCAARIGYKNLIKNDKIKIGFIGAIKDVEIFARPNIGETIRTEVEVKSEVFAITLIEAKVFLNEKLLAKCEMKISLSDK
ncbi:MAG: pseudouridylate synthase [Bacteroidales bacterium]